MSSLKRLTDVGLAHTHTWHTLPSFPAGSLAEVLAFDAPNTWALKERETLGTPQLIQIDTGNEGPIQVKGTLPLLENSSHVLLFLVSQFGNDTPSGAGDPYTHEMIWQDVAGACYIGAAWEPGTDYKNIPSFSLDDVTMNNADGLWNLEFTGIGDQIDDGTSATLSIATQPTTSLYLTYPNTTLRLNTEGSGALASPADVVEVSNMSVKFARPKESTHVCGSGNITAPTEGAMPFIELTFEIPEVNTLGEALIAAYVSGATYKGDITITGSTADRGLVINFPSLRVTEAVSSINDPVQKVSVKMKALQAAAAPTGMDQVVTYLTYKCSTAASPIA